MKYDLVFEGGGAKGIVLVGAYEVFSAEGHTFGRLLGTSAGAITAALLAAGYSAKELLDVLAERENGKPVFAGFMGEPAPFDKAALENSAIRAVFRNIDFAFIPKAVEDKLGDVLTNTLGTDKRFRNFFAFVERGGWYSADRFLKWMQDKLDTGQYQGQPRSFSKMTLAEFYAATQTDLSLIASDTHANQLLVLNHRTAPKLPLVWAVRMSMSIPLVWNEVIWDGAWGTYQGRDVKDHAIVDGGILSNFPIELFISDAPQVTRLMGPKQDNAILGLLIDDTQMVQRTRPELALVNVDIDPYELRTVQRILRLVNTMTTAHDKMVIDEFRHLVAKLPAGGYGVTEFDLSDVDRNTLVESGRQAMKRYFSNPPQPIGAQPESAPAGQASRIADDIATRILEP
ncbi:MAG: patatin-like phospholipase family protein [Caldilineaceae bacterium]|nr:patatin-like phospholipase family protein [Caldilineaceae bacterium]